MPGRTADYKGFGYEVHKNGNFWHTYVYNKEPGIDHMIIDILRFLVEPNNETIHKNIDQMICFE